MTTIRDERARYQQIAAELRALIMTGELAPGSQLPSTAALTERFSAANTTIQRALGALKGEGFLTGRAGVGVFVRDRHARAVAVQERYTPGPGVHTYRIVKVTHARPPQDVAGALGLTPEGTAVTRQLLAVRGGEPFALSWSYYPADIALGTPLASDTKIPIGTQGGALGVLTGLGFPQRYFVDRVSARMPTSEELERLELPEDVPVLRQFRVVYSDHGRAVKVTVLIKGAHVHELQYRQDIPA